MATRNQSIMAGAIFLGGMAGTWLRAGVDLLLSEPNFQLSRYLTFSCGLFIVNLAGAFLLGYLGMKWEHLTIRENREGMVKNWHAPLRTGVTTGIFGALTTYSSMSLLVAHKHIWLDILALVFLFVGGIMVATWGRRWARKRYAAPASPESGVALEGVKQVRVHLGSQGEGEQ